MSRFDTDLAGTAGAPAQGSREAQLLAAREVPLGGPRALLVRRTLPHRQVRTIGAWCFVDHFGPAAVAGDGTRGGMQVPPHPHIGLQTVTWLYAGEVLHRDSLGSVRRIRPGELNLMTAGRGIAHAEDSVLDHPGTATLHGLQLWVALPDADRHQPPHFEHHADLPTRQLGSSTVTVVVGALGGPDGLRSPAATYSPILGADVVLAPDGRGAPRADIPLDPAFEHGVLAVEGAVRVDGRPVGRGSLLHLPPGRRALTIESDGAARAFLLGGPTFGERLVMWWNFVGRDHADIALARDEWESGRVAGAAWRAPPSGLSSSGPSSSGPSSGPRFARVDHPAPALPAPALPAVRLLPR
jgi:redox-sensitive bicupin YhaK (pirin superfamily)